MPITQYRFLEVLKAASIVLRTQQSLIPFARDFKRALTELDQAREQGADVEPKLSVVRAYVHTMSEMLIQSVLDGEQLNAIIHAEQKYFEKNERKNNNAAMRQRRFREKRKGHLPAILSGAQSIPENPPEAEATVRTEAEPTYDAEAMRRWQAGGKASEASPMLRHLSGEPSTPTVTVTPDPEVAPDQPGDKDIMP